MQRSLSCVVGMARLRAGLSEHGEILSPTPFGGQRERSVPESLFVRPYWHLSSFTQKRAARSARWYHHYDHLWGLKHRMSTQSGVVQLNMFAKAEQHLCLVCGADISHRRRDARLCEPCSKVHHKERQKTTANRQRRRQRHREKTGYNPEGRTCENCSADISSRGHNAKRCVSCQADLNKERKRNYYSANRTTVLQRAENYYQENRSARLQYAKDRRQTPEYKQTRQEWKERNPEKFMEYRQRKKQRHRKKTGYNPEGRTCEDCNADISHRGHNAKRCVPCSTPPTRTCMVCHIDISHRGPRAQFCGEECKQRDQQLKELEGYTKTCAKCSETKEHTEFRLRHNRRNSTCKSCEASATQDYYRTLPVEERRRRRRIQGERERIKTANLPPGERTILRTKARQAHRRRLYGPDFDEDRLYSEQGGKCAICGIPKPLEDLELDHDHETDKLRGFLCKNCNFKLLPRYEKFPQQHQDSPRLNAYLLKGKRQ